MDDALCVHRILRAFRAIRRILIGPPAHGTGIEAAACGGAEAERGVEAAGQRGFAPVHAGYKPLSGPADDGVPARLQYETALVSPDCEAEVPAKFRRQGCSYS